MECEECLVPLDENDECPKCCVYHGDPCAACGRRGYHKDDCAEIAELRSRFAEMGESLKAVV